MNEEEILDRIILNHKRIKELMIKTDSLEKKLDSKQCPHGTIGGWEHCMACRPELKTEEKEKTEPEKIYFCKECNGVVLAMSGYELVPINLEERVRDATRKELIEDLIGKLDEWLNNDDANGIAFVINLKDEYEKRIK